MTTPRRTTFQCTGSSEGITVVTDGVALAKVVTRVREVHARCSGENLHVCALVLGQIAYLQLQAASASHHVGWPVLHSATTITIFGVPVYVDLEANPDSVRAACGGEAALAGYATVQRVCGR